MHFLSICAFLWVSSYAENEKFYLRLTDMPKENDELLTERGWIRIIRTLGEGAYGRVYLAQWDKKGEPLVAIKVDKKDDTVPGGKDRDSFPREYKLMKMMNQNRVVGFPIVHGSVMDGDYRYYFMDVAGESLLNRVRNNGPFKTGRILPFALQLLERLESVHAMGYAMIDLHPGNILLKDRTVFLIDLGLAKRLHTGKWASRRSDLLDFILCLEYITTESEYWNDSGPMDLSPWLIPAWRYVDSLGFSGTPNYRHLVSLLRLSARLA